MAVHTWHFDILRRSFGPLSDDPRIQALVVTFCFGALQVSAARESDLSPELLAAANSSGGVLGKMISPQNPTIACAVVGLVGREGVPLRKVLPWSLGLLLVMCLIVVGQSTPVLEWMLP